LGKQLFWFWCKVQVALSNRRIQATQQTKWSMQHMVWKLITR